MTLDEWKVLLTRDRPAAIKTLMRIEYDVSTDDGFPSDDGLEVMRDAVYMLHLGEVVPYVRRPDAELVAVAERVFAGRNVPTFRLEILYDCPKCGQHWQEEYECACDSECPTCGCGDVEATSWREI